MNKNVSFETALMWCTALVIAIGLYVLIKTALAEGATTGKLNLQTTNLRPIPKYRKAVKGQAGRLSKFYRENNTLKRLNTKLRLDKSTGEAILDRNLHRMRVRRDGTEVLWFNGMRVVQKAYVGVATGTLDGMVFSRNMLNPTKHPMKLADGKACWDISGATFQYSSGLASTGQSVEWKTLPKSGDWIVVGYNNIHIWGATMVVYPYMVPFGKDMGRKYVHKGFTIASRINWIDKNGKILAFMTAPNAFHSVPHTATINGYLYVSSDKSKIYGIFRKSEAMAKDIHRFDPTYQDGVNGYSGTGTANLYGGSYDTRSDNNCEVMGADAMTGILSFHDLNPGLYLVQLTLTTSDATIGSMVFNIHQLLKDTFTTPAGTGSWVTPATGNPTWYYAYYDTVSWETNGGLGASDIGSTLTTFTAPAAGSAVTINCGTMTVDADGILAFEIETPNYTSSDHTAFDVEWNSTVSYRPQLSLTLLGAAAISAVDESKVFSLSDLYSTASIFRIPLYFKINDTYSSFATGAVSNFIDVTARRIGAATENISYATSVGQDDSGLPVVIVDANTPATAGDYIFSVSTNINTIIMKYNYPLHLASFGGGGSGGLSAGDKSDIGNWVASVSQTVSDASTEIIANDNSNTASLSADINTTQSMITNRRQLRTDRIDWNNSIMETVNDATTSVILYGQSAYPYSGTFEVLEQRTNNDVGSIAPAVAGYNSSVAPWGGLEYQTSDADVNGVTVTTHYIKEVYTPDMASGQYTFTITQVVGSERYVDHFTTMHMLPVTVDTSNLATKLDMASIIESVTSSRTLLKARAAIANASKEMTGSVHSMGNLQFGVGDTVATETTYLNRDGTTQTVVKLISYESAIGGSAPAVILNTTYSNMDNALNDAGVSGYVISATW